LTPSRREGILVVRSSKSTPSSRPTGPSSSACRASARSRRAPSDVKRAVDALLAERRAETQVAECLNCNAKAIVVRCRYGARSTTLTSRVGPEPGSPTGASTARRRTRMISSSSLRRRGREQGTSVDGARGSEDSDGQGRSARCANHSFHWLISLLSRAALIRYGASGLDGSFFTHSI
jgi:hypothetical protein